ncbi:sigma-70 family RNA polymerase sigma factor [bacterium]|nr:sigma-70 family RNA polymerase sigma factor [bacterium]
MTAKQHPYGSLPRQIPLGLLMKAILSSGRLQHPQKGSFSLPQSLYKEVRNEAIQQALFEVCQKIEQYDPSHEVMAWVNFLLDRRFIDACRKYCRQGITQVPRDTRVELQHTQTQEDFDKVTSNPLDCDSELADLIELVESDPEGIFSREHIRKRSDVTFQAIFLAKFKQDRTWEEITEIFGISSISTVHTFFGRCLKKLRPYFQKYL